MNTKWINCRRNRRTLSVRIRMCGRQNDEIYVGKWVLFCLLRFAIRWTGSWKPKMKWHATACHMAGEIFICVAIAYVTEWNVNLFDSHTQETFKKRKKLSFCIIKWKLKQKNREFSVVCLCIVLFIFISHITQSNTKKREKYPSTGIRCRVDQ